MGIVILTLLYIAIFLITRFDNYSIFVSPFVAIPVILAAWYYGVSGGFVASVAGIILNAVLFSVSMEKGWEIWLEFSWPGNVMVILVGYITGRFKQVYEWRLHTEKQLRSRERYLTLVNLTINDVLSLKDIDDKYYSLISHLVNLFVADFAFLAHWESAQERIALVATTKSSEQSISGTLLSPDESMITASVLRTGHPLVIENLSNTDYIVSPLFLKDPEKPTGSLLCIPLIAGEFKFGAVIIVYGLPSSLTTEDISYAEIVGKQLGLALWTTQQEIKIQKQLVEANALANIGRVLSETERVGIETVLDLIVNSAQELIPSAEKVVLHLLDDEHQILIPRAVAGYNEKAKMKLNMRLGEGVAGHVIETGETIVIPDVRTDPLFLKHNAPVEYRSLIVAPVQSNKRRVGTLSIHSNQSNAFTPDECRLLSSLGTLAAIAIENANLLETTQQDLKEINVLYQLSQSLAASLDPDQLMKVVVELLVQHFGYYHVQIYVIEPLSGDATARCGAGVIGDQLREQGFHLPAGASIIGHVADTGQPFVTNEVDEVVFFRRNPLLPDTQSEMSIPIKIDNQVLGVLDIQQTALHRLTSRDMKLMKTIADQLAVSLQKANLYTDLQTSLRQEKSMRSQLIQSERLAVVGRLLASVSHELGNPLQALQNVLYLLKDENGISDQGQQDLQIALEETERMTVMIDRLRATYRPTRVEDFQEIRLNEIVEDVRALTATLMRHKGIDFEFYPDAELPAVQGIPDQIRQVILNLFVNAIDAMHAGGCLSICTQNVPKQKKIHFSVKDTGSGIDPAILPHLFEPFITNKESGTGLGLTITHDIIRQHKGSIRAENNPQSGATFDVWLPVGKKRRR